jgi:hypothetical protein
MQQEDGLCAEMAADTPPADPDGEDIYRHENFQRKPIHVSLKPSTKLLSHFALAVWTKADG